MKSDNSNKIRLSISFAWAVFWRCVALNIGLSLAVRVAAPNLLLPPIFKLLTTAAILIGGLIWLRLNSKTYDSYTANLLTSNIELAPVPNVARVIYWGVFCRWFLIDNFFKLLMSMTYLQINREILVIRDFLSLVAVGVGGCWFYYSSYKVQSRGG